MGVGLERVLVVNWEAWPGLGFGERDAMERRRVASWVREREKTDESQLESLRREQSRAK